MALLSRRVFLRRTGAAAIVGGSVAAPVAADAALASDALARARHHWDQFSAAMDELTAGHGHGWVSTGGHRLPYDKIEGGRFMAANLLRVEIDQPHARVTIPVDRHYEIIGLRFARGQWQDEATGWADREVRL